jgi:hypothetical protein
MLTSTERQLVADGLHQAFLVDFTTELEAWELDDEDSEGSDDSDDDVNMDSSSSSSDFFETSSSDDSEDNKPSLRGHSVYHVSSNSSHPAFLESIGLLSLL